MPCWGKDGDKHITSGSGGSRVVGLNIHIVLYFTFTFFLLKIVCDTFHVVLLLISVD